jgi:hypothetical protein
MKKIVVIEREESLLLQTPATRLLRELGYDAINLDGGYMTWSNSPANSVKQ